MAELNSLGNSDARRIQDVLAGSSYQEIRQLRCELRNNIVMVSGRLSSFYQKQVAISLVLRCLEDGAAFDHDIEVVIARST